MYILHSKQFHLQSDRVRTSTLLPYCTALHCTAQRSAANIRYANTHGAIYTLLQRRKRSIFFFPIFQIAMIWCYRSTHIFVNVFILLMAKLTWWMLELKLENVMHVFNSSKSLLCLCLLFFHILFSVFIITTIIVHYCTQFLFHYCCFFCKHLSHNDPPRTHTHTTLSKQLLFFLRDTNFSPFVFYAHSHNISCVFPLLLLFFGYNGYWRKL